MRWSVVFLSVAISWSAYSKTYFLELKGWPAELRPKVEEAANELASTEECWNVTGSVATHASAADGKECHQFKWFKSEKDLKPWKRTSTHRKLQLTYTKGKEELMLVQIFEWDRKKLRRVLNSSQALRSETNFKDAIVLWALK